MEKTVKSTSQQGVGLLRECLNVCVPGRKGNLKVNEMTAESQVQLINSEHLDLKENGENTSNNLTDLYNHHPHRVAGQCLGNMVQKIP